MRSIVGWSTHGSAPHSESCGFYLAAIVSSDTPKTAKVWLYILVFQPFQYFACATLTRGSADPCQRPMVVDPDSAFAFRQRVPSRPGTVPADFTLYSYFLVL